MNKFSSLKKKQMPNNTFGHAFIFVDTIFPVLSTHPFDNDKVASLEWDNIVAFYYFTVSKIWSDKSGGFWLEWSDKREGYCI